MSNLIRSLAKREPIVRFFDRITHSLTQTSASHKNFGKKLKLSLFYIAQIFCRSFAKKTFNTSDSLILRWANPQTWFIVTIFPPTVRMCETLSLSPTVTTGNLSAANMPKIKNNISGLLWEEASLCNDSQQSAIVWYFLNQLTSLSIWYTFPA